MWIVKGVSVGTVLFILLSLAYVVVRLRATGAKAIGTTALYGMTVQNPAYWVAFGVVLLAACISFRLVR